MTGRCLRLHVCFSVGILSRQAVLVPAFAFHVPAASSPPSSWYLAPSTTENALHATETASSADNLRGPCAHNGRHSAFSRRRNPLVDSTSTCARRYRTRRSVQVDGTTSSSSSSTPLDDAQEGGCDRLEFLKATARRTAVVATSGVAASSVSGGRKSGGPQAAEAFCGEPYPYWAYFTDFDEGFVQFELEGYKGQLWVRTVGNQKEQEKAKHNPLVLIPGGPGLPHDYLETLEGAAKDDRVVVTFDPIGTGNSSALPAEATSALLGTTSLVAQTNAVLDFVRRILKLSAFHLLGHGTGAAAALEIGRGLGRSAPVPPFDPKAKGTAGIAAAGVLSVTLASPVLKETALPSDFVDSLRAPYTRGGNEAPLCLETAIQGKNAEAFAGGVAALKKEGGVKDAVPLACPVLITYGGRDVIGDGEVTSLKAALSGEGARTETQKFEGSGHLAHLDEREEYVTLIQNYLAFVDQSWAGPPEDSKKK